ncbi:unnamed protein product, partial [Vitis vinifera]
MHLHLFYFKSSYIFANASLFLLATELWPLVVVESHASLRSELYWPLLTLTAGDSDLPSEIYWNSVLPNTPMPQAVKNSLRPGVSKGGVSVSTGHEEKPGYVGVTKAKKPIFFYRYAATEDQLHAHPSVALFFLEKDMRLGTKMNLDFMKNTNEIVIDLELKERKSIVQPH